MRNLIAEPRLHLQERSPLGRRLGRIGVIAAYCALAIIAAIVFGTLSVHPFH
jgi:hypothetical protein